MLIGAVILATDDTGFSGPAELGGQCASLVEIAGEPLVSRVVTVVRGSECICQVVVVGGEGSAGAPYGADLHLSALTSPRRNFETGLAALDGCSHAVILSGNLPFLTRQELMIFVSRATEARAPVVYPMVPLSSCQAEFPMLCPRSFRLAEGEVTVGHALFVHRETFLARSEVIDQVTEILRKPGRIASIVSMRVLLSFGMGHLTVDDLAQTASSALGIQVAALLLEAPGLAVAIRKPIDVRVAREKLGRQN
ncbi:MAG: NTP transferase domain-containing protein [Candidatus Zipacnadales bacterium]